MRWRKMELAIATFFRFNWIVNWNTTIWINIFDCFTVNYSRDGRLLSLLRVMAIDDSIIRCGLNEGWISVVVITIIFQAQLEEDVFKWSEVVTYQ